MEGIKLIEKQNTPPQETNHKSQEDAILSLKNKEIELLKKAAKSSLSSQLEQKQIASENNDLLLDPDQQMLAIYFDSKEYKRIGV